MTLIDTIPYERIVRCYHDRTLENSAQITPYRLDWIMLFWPMLRYHWFNRPSNGHFGLWHSGIRFSTSQLSIWTWFRRSTIKRWDDPKWPEVNLTWRFHSRSRRSKVHFTLIFDIFSYYFIFFTALSKS